MLREMQQHDVLVLPSLFEGFGLVILEAMAQGAPVIVNGGIILAVIVAIVLGAVIYNSRSDAASRLSRKNA